MEKYIDYEKITEIDQRHILLGQITGGVINLRKLHNVLGNIEVNSSAPEDIRGQFNVARNMALYTFFCYSLAPEVHMKTFSVMEMALRHYYKGDTKTNLKKLVGNVVAEGVVCDNGFRHVPNDSKNPYSKTFVDVFPNLRNTMAHGTTMLVPDCIGHIEKCADFVNQLFQIEPSVT